ncbi:hypothetical protein GCM10010168_00220 [Actinoplanes ianthinogenes]|uniref:Uncharacterized protein n=1 Tax=Actinoplanes ianthinogenes TaxID=122358 RepID=A0ABN6CE99_9ACTN|nr:hypothetical protein [Actinoplanes ianthinogenes]BCJ43236.1 hypothetical protein Aiant_38930 [Actinoplanes ianthinogenes]GGQ89355.1 hypothetical protein GCM10010168_00220 [Actinoplanes ianthinogenes]
MADLLIAALALAALAVVLFVLFRAETLGRAYFAAGLAIMTLAAAATGVLLYRSHRPDNPAAKTPPTAQAALGAAVLRLDLPLPPGDKYPQAAILLLDPPRPGPDAWTGDISLICSTPGKDDGAQHCTGDDVRVWSADPLEKRSVVARAVGDPFGGPEACAEANGATYQSQYMELEAGRAYCMRRTADPKHVTAFRIPAFPAEKPLPTRLTIETAGWPL